MCSRAQCQQVRYTPAAVSAQRTTDDVTSQNDDVITSAADGRQAAESVRGVTLEEEQDVVEERRPITVPLITVPDDNIHRHTLSVGRRPLSTDPVVASPSQRFAPSQ